MTSAGLECSCDSCEAEDYQECTHKDPSSPIAKLHELYSSMDFNAYSERYELLRLAHHFRAAFAAQDIDLLTAEQQEAIGEWVDWTDIRDTNKIVTHLELRRLFTIFDTLFFCGRLQATVIVKMDGGSMTLPPMEISSALRRRPKDLEIVKFPKLHWIRKRPMWLSVAAIV